MSGHPKRNRWAEIRGLSPVPRPKRIRSIFSGKPPGKHPPIVKKVSKAEVRLAEYLRRWGIPFEPQRKIKTAGGPFTVDFLVGRMCVVECEGAVHSYKVAADNERETLLRGAGYDVLRFPNFLIFNNISEVLKTI